MREAIHQDEIKLQQTLEQLKQGYLEYTGEYGAELTTFIPFVAHNQGITQTTENHFYKGCDPITFF